MVVKPQQIAATFGRVLREQRLAAGMSQEGLALNALVDRTFVSQLERGVRQPTLTTVFRLAAALGVAPADLIQRMERGLRSSARG